MKKKFTNVYKGYLPEVRGYVIYSPRALPSWNKSHNPSLQAEDIPVSSSSVPLSLVVGVSFAVLSDVLCAPRFLVDVFFFVVHAEFEVGVLAPEEFRWKILLGEDLEPLVVLVCHLHEKLLVIHRW